jgi:hypothetical protein
MNAYSSLCLSSLQPSETLNIWSPTATDVSSLTTRPLFSFWGKQSKKFIDCADLEEAERLLYECSPPFLHSMFVADLNEDDF